MKGRKTPSGYLQVSIKIDEKNKFMNQYVHRLVAQFWLDKTKDKEEVNHIDGDKKNNNINNLEWVTKKENAAHKINVLKKKTTSNKKIGMLNKSNQLIKTFNSVKEAG